MANTSQIGIRYRDVAGIRRRNTLKYTGPASYVNSAVFATSGDPIAAGDILLGTIDDLIFIGIPSNGTLAGNIYDLFWDRVNSRIHWVVGSTGADAANTTNLSTFSIDIEAYGK